MSLDRVFKPRSIIVVGASRNVNSISYRVIENILGHGYRGDIYPVNPKGGLIHGLKIYKSIKDTPGDVDLALIFVRSDRIPSIIDELSVKGVKGLVIYSSGFGEVGRSDLEEMVRDRIDRYGMRLLGPNCAGLIYMDTPLNASMLPRIGSGDLALISQSGAFTGIIAEYMISKGLGLRALVSIGNRIDISEEEVLEYLTHDKDIKGYMMYIEGLGEGQGRRLFNIVRRESRPVVILKAGRGRVGARAVKSHVGSLAGSYRVFRSVMEIAGAYIVDEYNELVDVAEALAYLKASRGNRVAIVTNSGGPSVILTGMLGDLGMRIDETPSRILDRMGFLPGYCPRLNPIDLTADCDGDRLYNTLRILIRGEWPDIVITIIVPPVNAKPDELASAIRDAYIDSGMAKPLIPLILGYGREEAIRILGGEPRLPLPSTHRSTALAAHALYRHGLRRRD